MAILFRSSGCLAPKDLNSFQSFDLSLPDEGDSRIVSCTLILKSMFLYHLITSCTCSPLLICHDAQDLRGPGWLNELGS